MDKIYEIIESTKGSWTTSLTHGVVALSLYWQVLKYTWKRQEEVRYNLKTRWENELVVHYDWENNCTPFHKMNN
jgi:hypothetical protein